MTTKDQDCRTWFEQGKQLPTVEKQYNYFSEGFRKGERYQAWAWAGVGLVWLQKGNVEGAIDAFEKALAMDPNIPGIEQQLQLAREQAAAQPSPLPEATPIDQPAPYVQISPPPLTETGSNQSAPDIIGFEETGEKTGENDEDLYKRAESFLGFKKEEEAETFFREILEMNSPSQKLICEKAAEIVKILRPGAYSYQLDRPKDWPEDIVEAWIQHVESMLGLQKANNKEDLIRELSENNDSETFVKGAVKLLLFYMREQNKQGEDGERASGTEATGEEAHEFKFPPTHQSEEPVQRLKREADEYHARGKINQAREAYLEYLKHVPKDAEVWCRLGEMSLDAGKKQRAEREFQECLKHDPKNAHAKDRLDQLKRVKERRPAL